MSEITNTRNSAIYTATTEEGFEESPLFYGRWTAEEERYAERLIEEFRDGNLEDADFEGGPSTLRGFLATKLKCGAKRISKKFESSGYNGRMQYVRKQSGMTPEEYQKRRVELESSRQGFAARRAGLPKKPVKKKRSLMSSASRRSTANSLARDAAIVANDPAFHSPAIAPTHNPAAVPAMNLTNSMDLLGSVVTAQRCGPSAAAMLARAQAQRSFATESILGSSRTLLPGLSALEASLLQPRATMESALLGSLLNPPAPAAAGLGLGYAAEALLKRRMDSARLYSIIHGGNIGQPSMMLQDQILQRKRLEEVMVAAQSTAIPSYETFTEGPPNKRPRAA